MHAGEAHEPSLAVPLFISCRFIYALSALPRTPFTLRVPDKNGLSKKKKKNQHRNYAGSSTWCCVAWTYHSWFSLSLSLSLLRRKCLSNKLYPITFFFWPWAYDPHHRSVVQLAPRVWSTRPFSRCQTQETLARDVFFICAVRNHVTV